jgi:hypothetical protein
MNETVGWLDASSGASGDMFLGALVGAGVPLGAIRTAVDAVAPEPVRLEVTEVTRNGFAATRVEVTVADSATHRTWRDIRALLEQAALDAGVRTRALATFARLAEAEAVVHGSRVDDVHFHEVGALDAIADVVGACAGLEHLALEALVVSPVAGRRRARRHRARPAPGAGPGGRGAAPRLPVVRRARRPRALHADRCRPAGRQRDRHRGAAADDHDRDRSRCRRPRPGRGTRTRCGCW